MTKSLIFVLWLLAALSPSMAAASDFSGDAGLVSDYRFRGISLSDGQPAAQASLAFEHDSGFYAGAWTSTIKEPGTNVSAEIQLYAGYEFAIAGGLTLDLSANHYAYPDATDSNYAEITAVARWEFGDAAAGLGLSFVPKQSGTSDEHGGHNNRYFFAEASYDLPGTPLKLSSSVGYERGYFDEVDEGGKWDWIIGIETTVSQARIGIAYIGSTAAGHDDSLAASLFFDF